MFPLLYSPKYYLFSTFTVSSPTRGNGTIMHVRTKRLIPLGSLFEASI